MKRSAPARGRPISPSAAEPSGSATGPAGEPRQEVHDQHLARRSRGLDRHGRAVAEAERVRDGPERGVPADGGRSRGGVGGRRRQPSPHRPGDRPDRGEDPRRQREHARRGRRGRVVSQLDGSQRDADRSGDEPRRRADPDQDRRLRHRRRRRRGLGHVARRRPAVADRARTAAPRPADRRRRPALLRQLRRRGGVDGQLPGRRARSRRRAHERRHRAGPHRSCRSRWPSAPARPGSASRAGPGRARCRRRPAPPSSPAARRPTC